MENVEPAGPVHENTGIQEIQGSSKSDNKRVRDAEGEVSVAQKRVHDADAEFSSDEDRLQFFEMAHAYVKAALLIVESNLNQFYSNNLSKIADYIKSENITQGNSSETHHEEISKMLGGVKLTEKHRAQVLKEVKQGNLSRIFSAIEEEKVRKDRLLEIQSLTEKYLAEVERDLNSTRGGLKEAQDGLDNIQKKLAALHVEPEKASADTDKLNNRSPQNFDPKFFAGVVSTASSLAVSTSQQRNDSQAQELPVNSARGAGFSRT